jgi:hypothetical protein
LPVAGMATLQIRTGQSREEFLLRAVIIPGQQAG